MVVYLEIAFFYMRGRKSNISGKYTIRIDIHINRKKSYYLHRLGMNPSELRGRRVGVYVGVSSSESEEAWTADPAQVTGYALTGCCRAMFPNRISYTFDFKGTFI